MVGDASVEYRKDDDDAVEISTDCDSFGSQKSCLSVVLEPVNDADGADAEAACVVD